ncbi:MAG: hypothetical protein EOO24_08890 [Comamonadaceae bacterium]|nr:MAG: hypothetical protein EOO24_08890 [Comamonadaceae bacterium]
MNPDPSQADPSQDYADAIQAEAAAWQVVRAALPGSGNFDAVSWQAWRNAQKRTEVARKAVMLQTSHVRLSAPEVTRPGFYLYTEAGDPAPIQVRVLRTPSLAMVRFPAPRGDVPLADLRGTFIGPTRR